MNFRKLTELPYHLLCSNSTERLVNILCDFTFIEASFIANKHFDLLEYYTKINGIHVRNLISHHVNFDYYKHYVMKLRDANSLNISIVY